MKKKILIISLIIILISVISIYKINSKETYTYEWIKEKDSAIGQYRLYINDKKGNHIDGTARLVYVNGKTKRIEIDKKGLLYVKAVVAEVRNPNKR